MGPAKQRAMRLFMITNIIFIVALLLLISSQSQRVAFRVQDRGVDATNQSNVPRAVDRGSDDDSNASGGFIQKCAYPGANFTSHYLGVYCLNNDVSVYGYNYSWCVFSPTYPSILLHLPTIGGQGATSRVEKMLRLYRIDLNKCVGNSDGTLTGQPR